MSAGSNGRASTITERDVRPGRGDRPAASPFRQPKAVWAVAFACVVSFMGIGLVGPAPQRRESWSEAAVMRLL